jgi:hypothetical protein
MSGTAGRVLRGVALALAIAAALFAAHSPSFREDSRAVYQDF